MAVWIHVQTRCGACGKWHIELQAKSLFDYEGVTKFQLYSFADGGPTSIIELTDQELLSLNVIRYENRSDMTSAYSRRQFECEASSVRR